MTRFQLSIFFAGLGALATASGCADGADSECGPEFAGCEYDASTGAALPADAGLVDTGAAPVIPVLPQGDASVTPEPSLPPNPGLPGLPGFPGLGRDGGLTLGRDAGPPPDTMLPTATGGTEPTVPAISGTCPEFKNGTVMVAGHKGVQLTVGAPNKKGALFFYWHGTFGNAGQVSQVPAGVRNEIISSGGIIASFNGPSSSQAEGDCSGTAEHNIADFKAADQIYACAVKNHGIDPRRVYTSGCSAGGLQSGCMAQLRSSYIAAAVPNSGGVVFPQKWQNAGKPAIFTMHGGPGDVVVVTFSETSATLDKSAKDHGSFVVNCNHGGSHCGVPSAMYTAGWQFMKDHPYGVDSPWKAGITAGIPTTCKIY